MAHLYVDISAGIRSNVSYHIVLKVPLYPSLVLYLTPRSHFSTLCTVPQITTFVIQEHVISLGQQSWLVLGYHLQLPPSENLHPLLDPCRILDSGVKVQFSLVLCLFRPNPEPDPRSGSGDFVELRTRPWFRFATVWFWFVLHSIKRSIQEMCLTFVVRRRLWE